MQILAFIGISNIFTIIFLRFLLGLSSDWEDISDTKEHIWSLFHTSIRSYVLNILLLILLLYKFIDIQEMHTSLYAVHKHCKLISWTIYCLCLLDWLLVFCSLAEVEFGDLLMQHLNSSLIIIKMPQRKKCLSLLILYCRGLTFSCGVVASWSCVMRRCTPASSCPVKIVIFVLFEPTTVAVKVAGKSCFEQNQLKSAINDNSQFCSLKPAVEKGRQIRDKF